MPGTPTNKYGLPTVDDEDFVSAFPGVHNAAVEDIDGLMATVLTGPLPDPGKFGRIHLAGDGTLSFDTGVTWMEVVTSTQVAGLSFVGQLTLDAGNSDIVVADQEWLRADGRLIDRTTYADYFARVGHAHNGGVDPGSNKVRIPDYRGRSPVGADNMGTALAAAGRLPNSNRGRGQNGGSEQHANTIGADGDHAHGIVYDGNHSHNIGFHAMSVQGYAAGTTARALADPFGNLFGDTTWQTNTLGGHSHGGATGGGGTHSHGGATGQASSMQPYGVDNFVVRVR